jgi:SAM-dependent methyltransferase
MKPESDAYLLAGQASELDRLQLQSRVWEPAGRALLAELPAVANAAAIDVGCGVMGWLRVLSEWVGPTGRVVGSDIDQRMLSGAHAMLAQAGLRNVTLAEDNLFDSKLPPASFDLVHARFQLAPLGRASQQIAAFVRLLRPGGILVLEEPDMTSWRVNPEAPATHELIGLIERGFLAAGGDFNAGRQLAALMRGAGLAPHLRAHVVALEPGHPYLRLPLQFAASLRSRLEALTSRDHVEGLVEQAGQELSREETWGTTFTLIQAHAFHAG